MFCVCEERKDLDGSGVFLYSGGVVFLPASLHKKKHEIGATNNKLFYSSRHPDFQCESYSCYLCPIF